jgi:hypothetical protein
LDYTACCFATLPLLVIAELFYCRVGISYNFDAAAAAANLRKNYTPAAFFIQTELALLFIVGTS